MLLMAIDQGTTSSRCMLFDAAGGIVASAQRTFRQIYPQNGWVEHNPMEIWRSVRECVEEAVLRAGVHPREIAALGITNQRETTVVWDRRTGEPIYNAIVWQCRRTAPAIDRLGRAGLLEMIRERTGLVADPYFSATKLQWILEEVPGARELADAGHLRFGTIDTWLIDRLTGGRVHATDRTNASRTMLYNIYKGAWDEDLLQLFGIPASMLPEVRPSWGDFGQAQLLGREIPICGVAGDQQAALFGQGCIAPGDGKNTYGTGCFLLLHTGAVPVASRNGLLTTLAASGPGAMQYALEGSVFVAGAVVQWLRDEMGLVASSAETEQLAASVPDTDGVYFVPAFTGLGAPYWDSYARGAIFGLTRGTRPAHIVRAALESMAFQTADVLRSMEADAGFQLGALRVDGGASANNLLMQMQADLLGCPVERPASVETTARGAAALAGLGCGLIADPAQAARMGKLGRVFLPKMPEAERAARLARWREAVSRVGGWAK